MAAAVRPVAGPARDLCAPGGGDAPVRRGGVVDGAGGLRLAAGAKRGRQLEQPLQAVRALAGEERLAGVARSSGGRRRPRVGDARQHRGARACLCRRGKKSQGEQALGRSRGGFSSKLHAAGDALGNPLAFRLTAGQQGDAPQALPLLDGITATAVIADKAYDADAILTAVAAGGALAVIPPKATRIHQRATDWHLYRQRHKIENLFGFIKHYRRVFARFDKLARRYLAFVHLVAVCILLR